MLKIITFTKGIKIKIRELICGIIIIELTHNKTILENQATTSSL